MGKRIESCIQEHRRRTKGTAKHDWPPFAKDFAHTGLLSPRHVAEYRAYLATHGRADYGIDINMLRRFVRLSWAVDCK